VHVAPSAPHVAAVYDLVNGRLAPVAVSAAQVRACPDLRFAATIHNGIRVGDYETGCPKDHYLLFMGRMAPEKVVHLAVEVARRLHRPLRIAAKTHKPEEIAYFESHVEPLLGTDVIFIGEVDVRDKAELLARSAGTLVPSQWAEPFGLVTAESLASATPVVALRAGAAPEIVDHRVTGFLAGDIDELVRLAARIDELDPAVCRRAAEERFTAERMVAAYEALYMEWVPA
jgi:glycosyltransferase involved in cell wall biosynthesis